MPDAKYHRGMDVPSAFIDLALGLMIGLLVGLQRERANREIGGLRTFGLVSVLGTLAALLAAEAGGWTVAAGLVAVAALIIVATVARMGKPAYTPGLTSEVAMLATFAAGAAVVMVSREVAAAVGAAIAVLLYMKPALHAMAAALGEKDLRAILQFTVLTFIVLPVVPDAAYGPYAVWNPRHIWLMVVLIVGLSLGGYLAYRFLGHRRGTLAAGLLGGLISSTATTVSASRSAQGDHSVRAAAAVVVLASSVSFARVLIEIAVVARADFWRIAPAIIILMGLTLAIGLLMCRRIGESASPADDLANPSRLSAALLFAAMYALILLAVAWIRTTPLGAAGVFAVAAISGLTDMDAITLSTARLARDGQVDTADAWKAIVVASIANMTFKAGIVAAMGSRALLARIAIPFAAVLIVAAALVLFGWW